MSDGSYITEYANSARSSRVVAKPRSYTQLHVVTRLPDEESPSFVLLDPAGTRVLVRGRTTLALDPSITIGDGPFRGIGYVTDWGAILGSIDKRWDGLTHDGYENYQERSPPFAVRIESGYQLAARYSPTRWTSVGQQVPTLRVPAEIAIYSRASDRSEWMDVIPGRGVAAIADDHVIVATAAGKVRSYASGGDAKDLCGTPRSEISIGEGADDVSITSAGTVVLSARGSATAARLVTDQVVWSAEVAFVSRQPAIDGGEGRVYIAGDGLAAIDRGAVLWSTPSVVPTRATAFADGTLAVCRGPGLQIVARDGSVVQQLTTSDGSSIVTPPAMGPDGSIWISTSTHVCVAR